MTIRLTLGFSLKSVGSFYVVPSEQIRPSVLTDTNVFFLFITSVRDKGKGLEIW